MRAITSNLQGTDDAVSAQRKEAVLAIEDHAGVEAIYEAVEAQKQTVATTMSQLPPTNDGSVYADYLGQIKALDSFPLIVAGIIEHGRKAETNLREQGER